MLTHEEGLTLKTKGKVAPLLNHLPPDWVRKDSPEVTDLEESGDGLYSLVWKVLELITDLSEETLALLLRPGLVGVRVTNNIPLVVPEEVRLLPCVISSPFDTPWHNIRTRPAASALAGAGILQIDKLALGVEHNHEGDFLLLESLRYHPVLVKEATVIVVKRL